MAEAEQRIDKWLFFARIMKSRSLAQKLVLSGAVRLNREKIANVAKPVRPGDVLTVTLDRSVRILKVREPGVRRGPASEATTLYEDLTPPSEAGAAARHPDGGSMDEAGYRPSDHPPTKRERRALDRLRRDGE